MSNAIPKSNIGNYKDDLQLKQKKKNISNYLYSPKKFNVKSNLLMEYRLNMFSYT